MPAVQRVCLLLSLLSFSPSGGMGTGAQARAQGVGGPGSGPLLPVEGCAFVTEGLCGAVAAPGQSALCGRGRGPSSQ